jgi:hypothetical protein
MSMEKNITICKPIRVILNMGRGMRSINGMTSSVVTSLEVVEACFVSSNP